MSSTRVSGVVVLFKRLIMGFSFTILRFFLIQIYFPICFLYYQVCVYFDIVAGVLQGDTLAPYLFIICLDYVLRTSIDKIRENGFELIKTRSRRYPATTITDADYADDIAILANTPDQAETHTA